MKCSRCNGTDSGCYVCRDIPDETRTRKTMQWVTRIEAAQAFTAAQAICRDNGIPADEVKVHVMMGNQIEVRISAWFFDSKGSYENVSADEATVNEALDGFRKAAESYDPIKKLRKEAEKAGFDLVERSKS